MNRFYSSVALAGAIALSACSAKITDDAKDKQIKEEAAKWPAFSDQSLAGKIFGKSWSAASAVARVSSLDSSNIIISLYAESVANSCSVSAYSSKPYATVSIPAAYTVTEYRVDLYDTTAGYKNALAFNETTILGANTYVADRSRVSVASIDETGFQAYIWATTSQSISAENVSEINGQIHVSDCRKAVAFSEWTSLTGNYQLQTFDGATQDMRPITLQEDTQSKFYDNASSSYIDAMPFPLYYSAYNQYNFGPMEGLGVSKVSTTATSKILQYSYNGPINYSNKDITLILDMTVTKQAQYLYVEYTLEVPGLVTKTSHKFTLVKSQY
ncbi:MAG: hypothetical protein H7256_08880 [Bdellovibrio sp.]|nr:hypothetical protein [Bdellovibrio sp.]